MVTRRRAAAVTATVLSMLMQGVLIVLGLTIVLLDADDATILMLMAVWCSVGTLYTILALIVLGRLAKRPAPVDDGPSRFEIGAAARLVSMFATIVPSIIGLIAAVMVVLTDSPDNLGFLADFVGVWAMLIAWGLMHWGFAQIYYQRHHRADQQGLAETVRFPETERPMMVDFVYFAYTIGATFATSDATVLTTRTRWLVTWHTVISFFFNGLIIVFALSTILRR